MPYMVWYVILMLYIFNTEESDLPLIYEPVMTKWHPLE